MPASAGFPVTTTTSQSNSYILTPAAFAKPECPTAGEAAIDMAAQGAVPGDGATYTTPKGATNYPKTRYTFELSASGAARMSGPVIPVYTYPNVLIEADVRDGFVWHQISAAKAETAWVYTVAGGIEPHTTQAVASMSSVFASLPVYVDDTEASAGGVPVGALYWTGVKLQPRAA